MMDVSVHRVDLLRLNQGEIDGIHRVLASSSTATVFHTLEWNRLLIEHFNVSTVALLARQEDVIVGMHVLFHYGDSTYRSPAINLQSVYGGPIASADSPAIIQSLLRQCERTCPLAYFQIWTSPNINTDPFTHCQYSVEPMLTPVMNLSLPEEAMWNRLHRDKRNKIRKAQKAGLEFYEANLDDVEEYHAMVTETLVHGGIKPLPLDFLRKALERLSPLGMARLFMVRQFHKPIAGTIILYHGDTAYGWDIGWRRDYSALSPNDFMIWEVAQHASRAGLKRLDLLRIEPDRLPGIARWKETFGCEIVPCYLLRRETPAFRLVKPVKIIFTQPQKVIGKLRTLTKQ